MSRGRPAVRAQAAVRRIGVFAPAARKLREPPEKSAAAAGLVYVSDSTAGIRRLRSGKGFRYLTPTGKPLRKPSTLRRIRALAIPPAWEDVWICPKAHGHVQATGRDARRRKQHRYHADFRTWRDQTKFDRMLAFVEALPLIRRQAERDLRRQELCREKVTAVVIRLLQDTLIRVGNEEYARQNRSFGLTTLRDRHARIAGGRVSFQFRGKSGVEHRVDLRDPRLARLVKACQDLPGQVLFQFVDDDGAVRSLGSAEVNQYLRDLTGQDFTAKDFRTWAGTVLTACALYRCGPCHSVTEGRRQINAAIAEVAQLLGNTRAVCRKCYVHPRVIECYLNGTLLTSLKLPPVESAFRARGNLSSAERAVLRFLKHRRAQAA